MEAHHLLGPPQVGLEAAFQVVQGVLVLGEDDELPSADALVLQKGLKLLPLPVLLAPEEGLGLGLEVP